MLCLFFIISSTSAYCIVSDDRYESQMWKHRIGKDCESSPQTYIDSITHETFQNLSHFKWYRWNINIGNEQGCFLRDNIRSDINDFINISFLKVDQFEPLSDVCVGGSNEDCPQDGRLKSKEKEVIKRIREITKKLNNFADFLISTNPNGPLNVRFPTRIGICTSFCDRESDTCLTLQKLS